MVTRRVLIISLLGLVSSDGWAFSPTGSADPHQPKPTRAQQEQFKEKFQQNHSGCVRQSTEKLSLEESKANEFCTCQMDVFAKNFSLEEMRIMELMTFGPKNLLTRQDAQNAVAALERVIPERRVRCGY